VNLYAVGGDEGSHDCCAIDIKVEGRDIRRSRQLAVQFQWHIIHSNQNLYDMNVKV
jgi:hypothetical protein